MAPLRTGFFDSYVDWFITDIMHSISMPSERARLAIVMTLMMILSPISYAGVSNWSGPSVINSEGTPTLVDGFTVPTNSTILDGWVHVTNSPLSSSPAIASIAGSFQHAVSAAESGTRLALGIASDRL